MAKTSNVKEFEVFLKLMQQLQLEGWQVLAACPPRGTLSQYPKCIFPHPDKRNTRRDEVDMICMRGKAILLLEYKPKLSDSVRPNANGETDVEKLLRIRSTLGLKGVRNCLSNVLDPSFSKSSEQISVLCIALGVAVVNSTCPEAITILELRQDKMFVHGPRLDAAA